MKLTLNAILVIVSTLLALNLVFQACKKEDNQIHSQISAHVPELNNVIFEDGRLKFASQADFENATGIMRQNKQYLALFEKQFIGFTSSKSAYFEKTRKDENLSLLELPEYMTAVQMSDGETYVRPSVDFHFVANLTNPKGIIQIGDIVYKYTYEKIYKTKEVYANLLDNSNNLDNNPNIEILPISRTNQDIVIDRAELIECEWFYSSGGSSRKFHAEIKSRIYPGYSQISVDFDHYKKSLGIWFLNDAPLMSFSGTVNTDCCRHPITNAFVCCSAVGGNSCTQNGSGQCIYSVSASGSNESEIFDVILEKNTGSHFSIATPTNVLFTGKGDNNVTSTCTTGM